MYIAIAITFFILGLLFGFISFMQFSKWESNKQIQKIKDEHDMIYSEIEKLIGTKSVVFLGRYNDNITFRIMTVKEGVVDMIFFFDKKDVSLFKKNDCIYGTHYANRETINSICLKLEKHFSKEINDCVKIMGNIIDRKTVSKLNPGVEFPPAFPKEPDRIFTIDDILDRISEVGLNNLTDEEKNFLNQYQNNKDA